MLRAAIGSKRGRRIGSGTYKNVFVHPYDESLVVKISDHPTKGSAALQRDVFFGGHLGEGPDAIPVPEIFSTDGIFSHNMLVQRRVPPNFLEADRYVKDEVRRLQNQLRGLDFEDQLPIFQQMEAVRGIPVNMVNSALRKMNRGAIEEAFNNGQLIRVGDSVLDHVGIDIAEFNFMLNPRKPSDYFMVDF
ncbi:MAG: hypothetical protein COV44_02100 [Deltaproteobacteria bacterium CG11_big_fil_rev_8_21_14_0_20_45_16]|nr:MAG: hypothetical protein COV44_02100 [Deltaproteobacteria bacterium CG11_big_fil_rev_8_21_14_0_20_45_16]